MFYIQWGRDKMAPNLQTPFQIHLLEWHLLNFDSNFVEIYFEEFNSNPAFARTIASILTKGALIYRRVYTQLGLDWLRQNAEDFFGEQGTDIVESLIVKQRKLNPCIHSNIQDHND